MLWRSFKLQRLACETPVSNVVNHSICLDVYDAVRATVGDVHWARRATDNKVDRCVIGWLIAAWLGSRFNRSIVRISDRRIVT